MKNQKVGIWIYGIGGNIGTTLTVVKYLSQAEPSIFDRCLSYDAGFANLGLTDFSKVSIGGMDLYKVDFKAKFSYLVNEKIIPTKYQKQCDQIPLKDLSCDTFDKHFSDLKAIDKTKNQGKVISIIRRNLITFKKKHELDTVICINLISTEKAKIHKAFLNYSWYEFETKVIGKQLLSCSTLFAIASFQENCHYINFTPNCDIDIPAVRELAAEKKVCFAGKDGKTGETLIKSALAPLFEIRKLNVLSWLSYNLLGNDDGKSLSNPDRKATKIHSKNEYLAQALKSSKDLYTKIEIDYVPSLGDWKTAINFIHFQGILNSNMTMQFTWQGCDTCLAVPLLIDLIRFTKYYAGKGECGYLDQLNLYFKSSLSKPEDLVSQYQNLLNSVNHG